MRWTTGRWRAMVLPFAALMAVVALGLSGCGVGSQPNAVVIPSGDVPSALLQSPPPSILPSPSPSPTVSPSVSPPVSISPSPTYSFQSPPNQVPASSIYLVSNDVLVVVHRSRAQTGTLPGLLTSLLNGPTDAELRNGINTAINSNPTLRSATIDFSTSIATVDLSTSFGDIRPPDQKLATAQVVMTALLYPSVVAVRIEVDGQPASVPLGDGSQSTGPLQWSDYSSLLAGASPSP